MNKSFIFLLAIISSFCNNQIKSAAIEERPNQEAIDQEITAWAQQWYNENYKDKPVEIQLYIASYIILKHINGYDEANNFYNEKLNKIKTVNETVVLLSIDNLHFFTKLLKKFIKSLSKKDRPIQLKSFSSKCLDLIKGDKNWKNIKSPIYITFATMKTNNKNWKNLDDLMFDDSDDDDYDVDDDYDIRCC